MLLRKNQQKSLSRKECSAVMVNRRQRVDEWNEMEWSGVKCREQFNDYDLYIKIKSGAQINL